MEYKEKIVEIKGKQVVFRGPQEADAEALIYYLKKISEETPYLIREPEEAVVPIEKEQKYIHMVNEAEKECMILAFLDGEHVGNCSIGPAGNYARYRHRCQIAIALFQKYWSMGIGTALMQEAMQIARECGYEQAELEVVADNTQAIILYEKLGFQKYGTFPHNMKYKDGSYADAYWMMKPLEE